jgi:HPt (histidine-containing phosphotransfer) domain-containing protein
MDDFLGKPAPMPTLADKLRRWLPHSIGRTEHRPSRSLLIRYGNRGQECRDGAIDRAALDELTGGDRDVASVILADYVDSLNTDMVALTRALTDASEEGVRRVAHCIKGAAQTVGAHEVAELAVRLEALASTPVDDWDLLRSTAGDLAVASARVAHAGVADLGASQESLN